MLSAEKRKKIITFSIQSVKFGVRLSDIVEVIEAESLMKLPEGGRFLFIRYREGIIPVLDIAAKFGFEHKLDEHSGAKVIVFDLSETVGLLVPSLLSGIQK